MPSGNPDRPSPRYCGPIGCLLFTILFGAFQAGCASGRAERPRISEQTLHSEQGTEPDFGRINFTHPAAPVGDVLRVLGAQVGGGIVLMNGLEERAITDITFRQTPYREAVGQIAGILDSTYAFGPHYYFIFPAGYESLLEVTPDPSLVPLHASTRASVAVGSKNALYNVFSMLGKSMETTIIADNIIAGAASGELFLTDTPLPYILEAILRSARISPGSFVMECTPEYIFIRGRDNTSFGPFLLNPDTMPPHGEQLLEKVVDLVLPIEEAGGSHTAFASSPIPLREALLPLSTQLGVEIVAHRRLAEIPINPCRMRQVRLGTALDLLLRQWPIPAFGYEIQENRILLRERQ